MRIKNKEELRSKSREACLSNSEIINKMRRVKVKIAVFLKKGQTKRPALQRKTSLVIYELSFL